MKYLCKYASGIPVYENANKRGIVEKVDITNVEFEVLVRFDNGAVKWCFPNNLRMWYKNKQCFVCVDKKKRVLYGKVNTKYGTAYIRKAASAEELYENFKEYADNLSSMDFSSYFGEDSHAEEEEKEN